LLFVFKFFVCLFCYLLKHLGLARWNL